MAAALVPAIGHALPVVEIVVQKCQQLIAICNDQRFILTGLPLLQGRIAVTRDFFEHLKTMPASATGAGPDINAIVLICRELELHLDRAEEVMYRLTTTAYVEAYAFSPVKLFIASYVRRQLETCILDMQRSTVFICSILAGHAAITGAKLHEAGWGCGAATVSPPPCLLSSTTSTVGSGRERSSPTLPTYNGPSESLTSTIASETSSSADSFHSAVTRLSTAQLPQHNVSPPAVIITEEYATFRSVARQLSDRCVRFNNDGAEFLATSFG